MSKIGFGELLIILIIALVVLGPEKLPQAARALGKAIGSVKKYVREASEELEIDELKQIKKDVDGIQKDLKSMGSNIEKSLQEETEKVEQEMQTVTQDVNDAVEQEPAAPKKAPQPDASPAEEAAQPQSSEENAAESAADITADLPAQPGDTETTSQEEQLS